MLQLFWHCLGMWEKEQKFITKSFKELSALLKGSDVKVDFKAVPLCSDLIVVVDEELHKSSQGRPDPFIAYYLAIRCRKVPRSKITPLLVYCKPCAEIVKAAKDQAKIKAKEQGREHNYAKPEWGYTVPGFLSAVYNLNNKYLLWHEVLHLFGAEDCHNGPNNPGPTCKLRGQRGCIMQYIPTENSVCEWPFLCKENVGRIQDWSKKHK